MSVTQKKTLLVFCLVLFVIHATMSEYLTNQIHQTASKTPPFIRASNWCFQKGRSASVSLCQHGKTGTDVLLYDGISPMEKKYILPAMMMNNIYIGINSQVTINHPSFIAAVTAPTATNVPPTGRCITTCEIYLQTYICYLFRKKTL